MQIHELAEHGLDQGRAITASSPAMGVPRQQLPTWDHIQFVTAQLAAPAAARRRPGATEVCIGPNARQPLFLDIPLFVSDMSFGALSQEAKTALARGAQLAGTGICSGEGGMLPEEQAESSRYFYELASARFGWSWDAPEEGAGIPLQARPGREDRHRRPSARTRSGRPHRRGARAARGNARGVAADVPRLARRRRLPPLRRRGARAVGRDPDRRQAVGAAHRGRHRRRARDRRRLHHPRRPGRRNRRRAAPVPRQHLGADDPGARRAPGAISTIAAGAT